MLKEWRRLWSNGSIMEQVVRKLADMTSDAEYVYTRAWEVCSGQANVEKSEGPLKEHDKTVNRAEREIRRMIVQHLNINPGRDVSGCLAVMIMAKDMERIGDHGRNIFGVAARAPEPVSGFQLFSEMDAVQKKLGRQFPRLEQSIRESSETIAHEILAEYKELKTDIKSLQTRLFETEMSSAEAVCSTLLTRFLMRINAHLGNVASGVIFPLENIDFVSRGLRQEEKDR